MVEETLFCCPCSHRAFSFGLVRGKGGLVRPDIGQTTAVRKCFPHLLFHYNVGKDVTLESRSIFIMKKTFHVVEKIVHIAWAIGDNVLLILDDAPRVAVGAVLKQMHK